MVGSFLMCQGPGAVGQALSILRRSLAWDRDKAEMEQRPALLFYNN